MEETTMKIDGALVRKLREERLWNQDHLAAIAGLGVRTIQRVEAEGAGSYESAMAIASAFGVSPLLLTVKSHHRTFRFGHTAGTWSGVAGALLGLAFAWNSTLSNGDPSGQTFGIMGALTGCSLAYSGFVVGRWMRDRARPSAS